MRVRCSNTVSALLLGPITWLFACVIDDPLGPPGKNMTGPVTSGAGENGSDEVEDSESESETETLGDNSDCDPLADPEAECGPEMACDLTSLECVPALGAGLEDDPCMDQDECSPGLLCVSGRCRQLCDADRGEGCELEQICSSAAEPIPGLCLDTCELVIGTCPFPGDACKRVLDGDGELWAACVSNPGNALTGDACLDDSECAPGYVCTDASEHTLPCVDDAASCCAPICDPLELPCFGVEPICNVLGISGQASAGYCGAA